MKKIIALLLVLSLAFCFVACKKDEPTPETPAPQGPTTQDPNPNPNPNPNPDPVDNTKYLVLVTDAGLGSISKNKVTNITLAIVFDAEGKIVAAQFDSFEQSVKVSGGAITPVDRITTKVEKGDGYTGMSASWDSESAAFEAFLIGKTAAEVAALNFVVDGADAGLVAGCTMKSSMPVFQQLVAKAAAYERKVAFETTDDFTLGLAIDAKFTGNVDDGAKVSADFAAVVVSNNTVLAAMLDSAEASFSFEYDDAEETYTTSVSYKGSKNDQGEDYDKNNVMQAGDWYKQAQAFANSFVGKTVAELADLPATGVAGCTVYAGGYKATLIRAAKTAAPQTYYLVLVTDAGLGSISKNKVTNITLAIVFDAQGKIVAAQFDSFEQSVKVTDGAITPVDRITTKVEKGDGYTGMSASWDSESAAFEAFLIGKTAAEVAALEFVTGGADAGLVAGCTMKSSMPVFQQLVAKAAAYERKVAFVASADFTLGLGIDAKFTGNVDDGAKVSADFAAVVVSNGTVLAAMLDSAEASFSFEYDDVEETYTVSVSYKGSKNDQGEDYDKNNVMQAGDWYKQAQAFANSFVGKSLSELADLPASGVAGCTVYAGGYKATLIRAAENA